MAAQQSDSGQLVQALRQLVPAQVPLATPDGVVVWSLGVTSVQVQVPNLASCSMEMAVAEAMRAMRVANFIFN